MEQRSNPGRGLGWLKWQGRLYWAVGFLLLFCSLLIFYSTYLGNALSGFANIVIAFRNKAKIFVEIIGQKKLFQFFPFINKKGAILGIVEKLVHTSCLAYCCRTIQPLLSI